MPEPMAKCAPLHVRWRLYRLDVAAKSFLPCWPTVGRHAVPDRVCHSGEGEVALGMGRVFVCDAGRQPLAVVCGLRQGGPLCGPESPFRPAATGPALAPTLHGPGGVNCMLGGRRLI